MFDFYAMTLTMFSNKLQSLCIAVEEGDKRKISGLAVEIQTMYGDLLKAYIGKGSEGGGPGSRVEKVTPIEVFKC